MIFLIESIVLCLAFTLMVYIMSRKPIRTLYNYPPKIQERVKSLDEYHNYWFHIKGFFIGEGLALVVCVLAGLIVQFVL
ncbi:MAG: hypothetical protein K6F86_06780 [Lachnospiraceae bacterium]|nr:hypothetical protein [Lachnospiraceae bacterium]